MTDHRNLMTAALKAVVIPELRKRGFKGSLPHFYRTTDTRADFLSFQFYSAGSSFVVEIAKCGLDELGADMPASKVNVTYFLGQRLRLGSDPTAMNMDYWFEFGPRNYDPPQPLHPASHYEGVAHHLVSLLDSQADGWWADPEAKGWGAC